MSNQLKISVTKINAMHIAEGIKNQIRSKLGMTSEEEEKLFEDRMGICKSCDYRNEGRCKVCNCVLVIKTKSFDSDCPKELWRDVKFNDKVLGYEE